MRTSLIEIRLIDQYLNARLSESERSEVEERIKTDNTFRINVFLQRKVMQLIAFYHRDVVRKVSKNAYESLMKDPANITYQEKIYHLFKN